MTWLNRILKELSDSPAGSYHAAGPPATEPTALAALALLGHERPQPARRLLDWLCDFQHGSGRLGTTADADSPGWPTSLAVLAWLAATEAPANAFVPASSFTPAEMSRWRSSAQRAVAWILETQGETLDHADYLGHDTTLVGWPWVNGTHSWVEPTALHVVALKAAGHDRHPRTSEGVRLLVDRQLPSGGCNVGNTIVLGMPLRPHLQPTGIAMLALAGETSRHGRIQKSLDYLARNVGRQTATVSLCWALLGLTAHGRCPRAAGSWLEAAADRLPATDRSPHKLALLALTALGAAGPLFTHLSRTQA